MLLSVDCDISVALYKLNWDKLGKSELHNCDRRLLHRDFPVDHKLTMDPDLADDNRLGVARRLYQAMCIQYPDRLIILVDPHGCTLARSDILAEPSAHRNGDG